MSYYAPILCEYFKLSFDIFEQVLQMYCVYNDILRSDSDFRDIRLVTFDVRTISQTIVDYHYVDYHSAAPRVAEVREHYHGYLARQHLLPWSYQTACSMQKHLT
jgi:hypothetical protein